MKMKRFLINIIFLLITLSSHGQFTDLVMIGNDTGFKSTTKVNAKAIFRGKYSSWRNGESVTIVLPSTKSENVISIASQVYNMTVKGMQKYWLEQVFQGRSNAPVFLEDDEGIINYVKRNPGSVAFVKSGKAVPQALIIQITE